MRYLGLLLAVLLAGCGGGDQKPNVRLVIELADSSRGIADVTKIKVVVTTADGKVLYNHTSNYTYGGGLDQAFHVPAGSGLVFTVEALRGDGSVEFTGTATADIVAGKLNTVSITLQGPAAEAGIEAMIHDIDGPPSIELTYVPPYGTLNDPNGTLDHLRGRVRNVLPGTAKVIVFIRVRGNWWVKPYFGSPFTPINRDDTFVTDIHTGGVDEEATEIRAYLVSKDYETDFNLPPDPVTDQVWTMTSATRTPP